MEITKMLTLSTVHITEETCEMLSMCASGKRANYNLDGLVVYKKAEFGYFLYICKDSVDDPAKFGKTFPDDLRVVISLAMHCDCELLCLDQDGPVMDFLESYDW